MPSTYFFYIIVALYNVEVIYMVKLRVLELLKENGKTKYWLYIQLGMSYQNFNKMVNNETKSIQYEIIGTLCNIFKCTPDKLFEIIPDDEAT